METVFILYLYLSDIEIHCKKILISLIYYSPLPASEVFYFQPNNLYSISSTNLAHVQRYNKQSTGENSDRKMAFTKLFYVSPNVREVKKLKYKVLAMRLKRCFIL